MDLILHPWVYFNPSFLQNWQLNLALTLSLYWFKALFFPGKGTDTEPSLLYPDWDQQIVTASEYWVERKVTSLLRSYWAWGLSVPCRIYKTTSHRASPAPTPPLTVPAPGFSQCGQEEPSFLHHDTRLCCLADAGGSLSMQVLLVLT